jgi:hypothetical protein
MLRNFMKGKCHKFQVMLSPYIDGRVTPAEKEALESHLASCQGCCQELESLRSTVGLLHRVPMETVPRSFTVVEVRPVTVPKVLAPMRWATAIAVVALALFFAGDLLHVYPEKNSSTPKSPIMTIQTVTPTPISGNRIGGSLDVTVEPTPPGDISDQPPVTAVPTLGGVQPVAPLTQTPAFNDLVGDTGITADDVDKTYRWPIHQIEFALLGMAAVMLATTIVVWRRGERVSVKDEGDE